MYTMQPTLPCPFSVCEKLKCELLSLRRFCCRSMGHIGNRAELSVLGSTRPVCTALPPELVAMSAAQNKLCAQFSDHMVAVRRGAVLALDECQWQFRNRRWNCSVPPATTTSTTPTSKVDSENDQRMSAAIAELLTPSITIGDCNVLL